MPRHFVEIPLTGTIFSAKYSASGRCEIKKMRFINALPGWHASCGVKGEDASRRKPRRDP
jgi:hypothetical protein